MADLISTLQCLFGRCKVVFNTPFCVTPTTTRQYLNPDLLVTSFVVRLRSLGTATYVAIGNYHTQQFRLTIVGESISWSGSNWDLFNLNEFYVISDSNDAVLEVLATIKEVSYSWL